MSGICIELQHFTDALTDCVLCFVPGFRDNVDIDDDDDISTPDNPRSVHTTLTLHSTVQMNEDYVIIGADDYLEACGRRISDTMSTDARDKVHETLGLTLDALLAMTPIINGQDTIKIASRHLLLSHVKSQDNVRAVFFPDHKPDEKYESHIDDRWFDFEHLSCLFVCQAICEAQDEFQIGTLLDEKKVADNLQALYTSPHWKKLGFSLYTALFQDLVKDERTKVPFSAYLDHDRRTWARLLSERVREKQWVYANLISPVVQGRCTDDEYNRDLNLLFIKLHLLDPTTVMSTYDYLRKALPDLNLGLVTTNYLGGPLDWKHVQNDVMTALQKQTYPNNNNPRLTVKEVEIFYGLEVLEFIMEEAKNRDLWTGKHPDNRRVSQLKDRCVIM